MLQVKSKSNNDILSYAGNKPFEISSPILFFLLASATLMML
jgi:16S rRNA A1518/A1519 N6-dimethyltransferase RsmA/KsgA/DIM1 with predicted DNA glycosylase/AP lyase activity